MKSREQWRRISAMQSKSRAILFGMGSQVVLKDLKGLKQTLHLQPLENGLMSSIFGQLFNHPTTIKIIILIVTIFVGLCMYVFWSARRMMKVKKLRTPTCSQNSENRDSNESRTDENPRNQYNGFISGKNYIYAALSHTTMDINVNSNNIKKLEETDNDLKKRLESVRQRLNAKLGADLADEKPPPYVDSKTIVEIE